MVSKGAFFKLYCYFWFYVSNESFLPFHSEALFNNNISLTFATLFVIVVSISANLSIKKGANSGLFTLFDIQVRKRVKFSEGIIDFDFRCFKEICNDFYLPDFRGNFFTCILCAKWS